MIYLSILVFLIACGVVVGLVIVNWCPQCKKHMLITQEECDGRIQHCGNCNYMRFKED